MGAPQGVAAATGSAVTLTGLAGLNYSWANPDGRLTDQAQAVLAQKFPGASVRVHGRDAIITGLPVGADVDAAHDLVRDIEGVRNVKEDTAAADRAVAAELADSIARDSRADGTVVVTTVLAPLDTAVASDITQVGVAPAVVAADAPTTVPGSATAPPADAPAATADAPATTAATATPPTPAATATTTDAPATTATTSSAAPAPASAESGDGTVALSDALSTKILFDSVSSKLDGESQTAVDRLVAYLGDNPDVRVKIVGHADAWGTRLTNIAVSRARADSVVSAIVGGGVERSRISGFAQGDRVPVASNATAEGRAANRRVEIVFFGAEGTGDREVAFTG